MSSVTLVFETNELIVMTLNSQSKDWPEGLVSDVMKHLKEKHEPEDTTSLVDEKVELNKIRMNLTDDPKVLFDKITSAKTRFSTKTHKIKEEEQIAVTLKQVSMKFKHELTNEQRLKVDRGVSATVKHL